MAFFPSASIAYDRRLTATQCFFPFYRRPFPGIWSTFTNLPPESGLHKLWTSQANLKTTEYSCAKNTLMQGFTFSVCSLILRMFIKTQMANIDIYQGCHPVQISKFGKGKQPGACKLCGITLPLLKKKI